MIIMPLFHGNGRNKLMVEDVTGTTERKKVLYSQLACWPVYSAC
jgi:hypothetical protein